ncbi:MAG TPA: ATP-binding protein, partial [Mycobacterium sp.]
LNATLTEVDLNAALDTALDNLSAAIDESAAEIVRPDQPLPTVDGDPTLLTMVWQNLIGNAVKFQREGTVPRVVIECDERSGSHDPEWLFGVSDNGIGIAEEFADKVFVIFQRLHVREVYSGTGIGLALCKKIVEHHDGSIWVDTSGSTRPQGARIRFTLPALSTAEPDKIPTPLLEGTHE